MNSKHQNIVDCSLLLLWLLLMNNLTGSGNVIENSSINCLSRSVYSYTNEAVQSDANELFETLSNVTNGSFCRQMLERFLCSVIFPPFNQSNNSIQTICPESCQNYVIDGICAVHVEAMIQLLMSNNMSDIADDLYNCSSPLLQPGSSISSECYNLTVLPNRADHVQCMPLPENDLCWMFGINEYAIDVSSKPAVVTFQNNLISLIETFHDVPTCAPFLNASVCSVTHVPCNSTIHKLLPICENDCEQVTRGALECIASLVTNNLNFAAFVAFSSRFNCSNTSTYLPEVSGSLFSSQNFCRPYVFDTDVMITTSTTIDEIEAEKVNVGLIVGPVVGIIFIVTVVLTTIMFLCWKRKRRNVIVFEGRLHSNAGYGQATLKYKNQRGTITSCTERQNLFQQYKFELDEVSILAEDLHLVAVIGEGAFGVVYRSIYQNPVTGKDMDVAVKGLKESSSMDEIKTFLEECCVMKQFNHPNVLPLIGVSVDNEYIPAMILPYMANGDVKAYLLAHRVSESDVNTYPPDITYQVLHKMCYDIAKGMEYLYKQHFVHRDLAARNCMVDSDMTIKVSDFGLCRNVYESDYYILKHKSRVPVKWMAPESLHDHIFSHQSDVWSYGVTCWEIFSLGRQPYAGIDNTELASYLNNGNRLDHPMLCSDEM